MENHEQVSHPLLHPLGIPQNPRDSHIPTATTTGHSPDTENQNHERKTAAARPLRTLRFTITPHWNQKPIS